MPGAATAKSGCGAPVGVSRCAPSATSDQPPGSRPATSSAATCVSRIWPASAWARTRPPRAAAGSIPSPVWIPQRIRRRRPAGHGSSASVRCAADRRLQRLRRRVEHGDRGAALALRPHDAAAAALDDRRDQLVVAHERLGHRLRIGIPEPRRVVDVRAADRDDAGRQAGLPARAEPLDQLPRGRRPARGIRGHTEPDRVLELARAGRVDPVPVGEHSVGGGSPSAARRRWRRARRCHWPASAGRPSRAPARGIRGCRCAGAGRRASRRARSRRA